MNIKIVSEFENKLFDRKEIKFTIDNGRLQTPKKVDVKRELCKKLSLNSNNMVIIKINQVFGSGFIDCYAHFYNKEEFITKFEPEYILKRKNRVEKVQKEKTE